MGTIRRNCDTKLTNPDNNVITIKINTYDVEEKIYYTMVRKNIVGFEFKLYPEGNGYISFNSDFNMYSWIYSKQNESKVLLLRKLLIQTFLESKYNRIKVDIKVSNPDSNKISTHISEVSFGIYSKDESFDWKEKIEFDYLYPIVKDKSDSEPVSKPKTRRKKVK